MDIIGQGAQYKVLDTADGRVRKVPLSRTESSSVVANWYAAGEAPAKELAIDYLRRAVDSCQKIRNLLVRYPELAASLGNPLFDKTGAGYTQDRVQPLGNVLASCSIAEGKQLLAAYGELVHYHWQYGFADRVYNCTVNNGVDKNGHVILLDFGEIATNERQIMRSIETKRWLESWSYQSLNPTYQTCYTHLMEKQITAAAFRRWWLSKTKA